MKKIVYFAIITMVILNLLACATKRGYQPSPITKIPSMPGIYHKVKRGETLWEISKIYNVDLDKIVKANKIPNVSKINAGQSIFIPYATQPVSYSSILSAEKFGFIWPVKGKVITHFAMKHNGVKSKGIIIRAARGTPVIATRAGKVSFCSDKLKGKGKTIIITHQDGFVTVYAHNLENLVKVGEVVKQGQIIAKVGSSGRAETPQLYFEIRKGHVPKNPFYYLP